MKRLVEENQALEERLERKPMDAGGRGAAKGAAAWALRSAPEALPGGRLA